MWKPRVLYEYEIGRAMSAIEEILLRNKPIADLGIRSGGKKSDLIHDLRACIQSRKAQGKVFVWINKVDGRFNYGFYSHHCILDAMHHMLHSDIDPMLRHVFLGLIFGYSPDSIAKFVRRQKIRQKQQRKKREVPKPKVVE